MEHAERNRHETGAPSLVGVAHGVVGLHGLGPRLNPRVEGPQQIRRNHRVGVDDDDRVGLALGKDDLERVCQRVTLAAKIAVETLEHSRAGSACPGGGVVAAVVGDDDDLEEIARVVDRAEAFHRLRDARCFIVCRNDDVEARPRLSVNRRLFASRAKREEEQIPARTRHRDRTESEKSRERPHDRPKWPTRAVRSSEAPAPAASGHPIESTGKRRRGDHEPEQPERERREGVVSSPKGTTFHIPSLDGLRAASFLVVFGAHAGLPNLIPGGFGVTVFFFLSGYLITTLMRMELEGLGTVSLKQFYLRRALRILPPFYLTLALSTAVAAVGLLPNGFSPTAVLAQSLHAANYSIILHGYPGLPSGTGVYRLLAVEEHFYLVFPVVFLALARWVRTPVTRAVILYGVCAAVLAWRMALVHGFHSPMDRTYVASDTRVDSILYGCALAVCGNPVMDGPSRISETAWKWLVLPAAVGLLLYTFLHRDPDFRETTRYTLQGIALTPVFITAIRYPNWLLYRPFNTRAASFIGVLSYSLYLVHHVILFTVQARIAVHPVGQAVVALGLSVAVAWTITGSSRSRVQSFASACLARCSLRPRPRNHEHRRRRPLLRRRVRELASRGEGPRQGTGRSDAALGRSLGGSDRARHGRWRDRQRRKCRRGHRSGRRVGPPLRPLPGPAPLPGPRSPFPRADARKSRRRHGIGALEVSNLRGRGATPRPLEPHDPGEGSLLLGGRPAPRLLLRPDALQAHGALAGGIAPASSRQRARCVSSRD